MTVSIVTGAEVCNCFSTGSNWLLNSYLSRFICILCPPVSRIINITFLAECAVGCLLFIVRIIQAQIMQLSCSAQADFLWHFRCIGTLTGINYRFCKMRIVIEHAAIYNIIRFFVLISHCCLALNSQLLIICIRYCFFIYHILRKRNHHILFCSYCNFIFGI